MVPPNEATRSVMLVALIGQPWPEWSTLTDEISTGSISTETTMRTAAALFVALWVWAMITIAGEALSILKARPTTSSRRRRTESRPGPSRVPARTRDTAGPPGPLVRLVRTALLGTVTTATTITSLTTAASAAPVHDTTTYITAPIEADAAGETVQAAAATVDSLTADGRQTPLSIAMDLGDEALRDEIIALNPDWNGGTFEPGATVIVPLATQQAVEAAPLPTSIPFGGLIGGVSVAAAIVGLLEAARRRRQRNTPLGAPEPKAVTPDEARSELALRSLAEHSHRDIVAAVTVLLSEHYRSTTLAPTVLVESIIVTDDGTVIVNFDEAVPAPEPFTGSDQHWSIDTNQLDDVDVDIDPDDQLFKTVVSLGRNAASEIFVDLESIGSITVTGNPDNIDGLCRSVRTQLNENIEILSNAAGLDVDDRHHTLPIDDTALANLRLDRTPLWDAIGRGDIHSIIHARLENWPFEQLVPTASSTTPATSTRPSSPIPTADAESQPSPPLRAAPSRGTSTATAT